MPAHMHVGGLLTPSSPCLPVAVCAAWRLQYTPVLVQEIVLVVLLTFTQVLVFSFLFGVLLHYIVKRDAEQVGL